MFSTKAKIISNKKIRGESWRCVLGAPDIARLAKPGQFINVKINDTLEPFLRRPFSIHRIEGGQVSIMYEVLGKGTKLLKGKRPGEKLDIIGSLGNGFDLSQKIIRGRRVILVAGGMGVAPLVFLAERLSGPKPLVLIGAKTKRDILCEKEFKKLGCDVKIATDNGSQGFKGYVSGLLKRELSNVNHRPSAIYACGPRPMLKEISMISRNHQIRAQVSLEEHMSCGFGACLGCVVDTIDGYKRACKDGPVFEVDKIIW